MSIQCEIENKIVLVTGANRGIGAAIVDAFVANDAAKVYAAVRRVDSVAPLREKHGETVVPVHMDLTDPASITIAAAAANDVEIVVNNAGVLRTASPLSDDAIDALTFEFSVNVFGLLHMARVFAPVLRENGGGAFVQLNSVVSMKCFPQIATYSASKAAAYSLTQALREELADQGTLVVSVHPGPIATDMSTAAGVAEGAEPPAVVAAALVAALVAALRAGEFHVFPDAMANRLGKAYRYFSQTVIEADVTEDAG